jgi:hypothetical protein
MLVRFCGDWGLPDAFFALLVWLDLLVEVSPTRNGAHRRTFVVGVMLAGVIEK